ncbi:MAG: S8 family serine peptidase, partial [Armatimonadetes bacterium]|nr:S8 family serine peptidase [Armatimonadota bacterium]
MAAGRAVSVAVIVALVVVAVGAGWGAELRTERYSPRIDFTYVRGRLVPVPDECVSGQCLIRISPTMTAAQFEEILRRRGARVLKAFPRYGIFLVSLPEGVAVRDGVEQWRGEAGVIVAEPNRIVRLMLTPNDPMYSQQWHWPKVNAPQAWDMTTGSQQVVVAVIDSGVDMAHEDLAGRIWTNANEIPGNGIDDDGNGYVDDVNGWDFIDDDNDPAPHATDPNAQPLASHGTHVAGIIGAATNNGVGVAGQDWQCRLMVLRVFDEAGAGTVDDLLSAMDYAIANGANVINLSLGGAYSALEDAPIQLARQRGIIVVAAAGNESHEFTDDPATWYSPVCNDGPNPQQDNWVLGVAATDQNDVKADFSNYDGSSAKTFVDVCAPGVQIWSCVIYDPAHGFDKGYEPWQGTSMATPVVAGLVSLIKAAWPNLQPLGIINQIKTTCVNIDNLNPAYRGKLGAGRIDSAQAIGLDMPPGPPRAVMAADTPNDEGGSITVTWSKSVDDGRGMNDVIDYVVYRCPSIQDQNGNQVPSGNWTRLGTVQAGQPTFWIDTPVPDHVPFWYKVSCRDRANEVESQPVG